jgi:hypothetical protein
MEIIKAILKLFNPINLNADKKRIIGFKKRVLMEREKAILKSSNPTNLNTDRKERMIGF